MSLDCLGHIDGVTRLEGEGFAVSSLRSASVACLISSSVTSDLRHRSPAPGIARPFGFVPTLVRRKNTFCFGGAVMSRSRRCCFAWKNWLGRQDSQPKPKGYDIKGLSPRSPVLSGIGPRKWTIGLDPGQRSVLSAPQPVEIGGGSAKRRKPTFRRQAPNRRSGPDTDPHDVHLGAFHSAGSL